MPYPIDLQRVLIGAPQNTLLRVQHIVFDQARTRCADYGIREGDEITCLGVAADHVRVELPTGGRVNLELGISTCIEVDVATA